MLLTDLFREAAPLSEGEHLEVSPIKGRIYAANVMDAGKIAETTVMEDAYRMGKEV